MTRSPIWRRIGRGLVTRRAAILMYHGVTPMPLSVFNWCHLPVSEFRAQMMYLKAHYRVVPLSKLIECVLHREPFPARAASITFDDAFRSVFELASPILQELDLPFAVFVVANLLPTGEPPWPERLFSALLRTGTTRLEWREHSWDLATAVQRSVCHQDLVRHLTELPLIERETAQTEILKQLGQAGAPPDPLFATMRTEDIRALVASGLAEIGVHSLSHAVLLHCPAEQVRAEIAQARERLRGEAGYVDVFAYPHGRYDAQIRDIVSQTGFRAAVTVEHRLCSRYDNPHELPRIGIGADDDLSRFAAKLLAFYS